MLHERRLSDEVAHDLALIYQAKLRLLEWLLRSPPHALDDDTPLVLHFGQALSDWLWARIRRPQTRTAFGEAVIALASKAQTAPAQAASVADAIVHDAQFHTQWADAGYELQFPRLYTTWLDAVKDVAAPFYDWLAGDGFEPACFGLMKGKMDRARVVKAFRPQSHLVCGYCDGPLGEIGSTLEANDCDHFFPKAQWPHLAIHPANLYSACKGCNSSWKGSKKPMAAADIQGLHDTYHPMLRPGVSAVVISATASVKSARRVDIKITDPAVPRRAETLVDTLDLAGRWTNSVNEKLDECVSVFVAKAARDKGRGWQPTSESVGELIKDDVAWQRNRIGKDERTLRTIATLEYQLTQQLPEIVADLS
jgi:hypothetical protein